MIVRDGVQMQMAHAQPVYMGGTGVMSPPPGIPPPPYPLPHHGYMLRSSPDIDNDGSIPGPVPVPYPHHTMGTRGSVGLSFGFSLK